VDPVIVSITVGRPREQVFDYLADMANHTEFNDHFVDDFHLTREDSVGAGAGARYHLKAPLQRFSWVGVQLIEVDRPWRIVAAGRGGKYNRTRTMTIYTLEPGPDDTTHLELSVETVPGAPTDRIMEVVAGLRGWTRRQNRRALRRIRAILEDGTRRGARATIAGR
jgi:uncharacterized protein YndB with AHSA1/START domain